MSATSMDFAKNDENTNSDNSENCNSTFFAHHIEPRPILNDDKSNTRYK